MCLIMQIYWELLSHLLQDHLWALHTFLCVQDFFLFILKQFFNSVIFVLRRWHAVWLKDWGMSCLSHLPDRYDRLKRKIATSHRVTQCSILFNFRFPIQLQLSLSNGNIHIFAIYKLAEHMSVCALQQLDHD